MSSLSMSVNLARTGHSDTMSSFNISDIATLTALCVVNLFFAGLMHRAVILSSRLLPRRQLFEGLSVVGFIVAIALCVFSALTWLRNPVFIIACTVLWSIFSTLVVARIWWGYYKDTHRDELELPDVWHESVSENPPTAEPVAQTPETADSLRPVTPVKPELPVDQAKEASVTVESRTATGRDTDPLKSESDLTIRRDKLAKYKRKRRAKTQSLSNRALYKTH